MKPILLLSILILSSLGFAADYVSANDFGTEPVVSEGAVPTVAAKPKCTLAPVLRWSGLAVAVSAGSLAVWQHLRISDANSKRDELEADKTTYSEAGTTTDDTNLIASGYEAAITNQEATADQASIARSVMIGLASLGLVGFGLSFAF